MAKISVVAAVPTYNSGATIGRLLPELLEQGYDAIYVLDDGSSDDTIRVAKGFGPKVKVVKGEVNVGAGANRNRIISQTSGSIIHFVDSDVKLLSKNTPDIIRGLNWQKNTAYFGGLLRNPNGEQNPYNFGPRPGLPTGISSGFQYAIWMLSCRSWLAAKIIHWPFGFYLRGWPNIFKPPKARQTFWTPESNLIIKSDTFQKIGGYDPRFRYGEVNDLALRFELAGYKTYFTPEIEVIHATVDNIFLHKSDKRQSRRQLIKKYGRLMYYAPSVWKYLAKKRLVNVP
ncbi:MAG TPA: glycosyltransferase [Candidatus Saccharimonadales bacterium]|nr:glycosyltransferase [Candidatus Saccharimonadales bacterium]